MGLDNGIVIKKATNYMKKVPSWAYRKDEYFCGDDELFLVYWRRNYSFRSAALDIIKPTDPNSMIPMTVDDVIKVREYLKSMKNRRKFGGTMVGIMEYIDARPVIARQVFELWWLIHYMKRHNDIEVYFLDSY